MLQILLLTYGDSDNVGDQIIETCANQLLKGVLQNLEFSDYLIDSKDIEYVDETMVGSYDLIVFGGGGIIKFKYQNFYKRISCILSVANIKRIPVIFNAVGVEGFSAKDQRCLILKEAINKSCVRQITTRDDLKTLRKYVINSNITIAKVADPAVFASYVYDARQDQESNIIGLCVVRGGIFRDNGKDWGDKEEITFWKKTISLITQKGFDYRLFTTGHFADEVFMLKMKTRLKIDDNKVISGVYHREKLINTIKQMKGVIAFRLHAGIISYSLGVPAVGLSWNDKVSFFYETVGMPERALSFKDWNAETVFMRLERALADRKEQEKDFAFIMSTYDTLYFGLRNLLDELNLLTERTEKPIVKYSFADIAKSNALLVEKQSPEFLLSQAERKINTLEMRFMKLQKRVKKKKLSFHAKTRSFALEHGGNPLINFLLRIYKRHR